MVLRKRAILANAVKVNFDAAKIKVEHRRHPLYPLDHASGNGCEEQLRRVEGVRPAVDVRVKDDLGGPTNPKLKRQHYTHYNLQAKIAEMLSRLASSLAE